MKFAHIADCHIGGWREPKMRSLVDQAFERAITKIIDEEVDFMIIAGDLFDTAIPGINHIKHAAQQLTRLKEADIPVYLIAGSHDYSPTGKTMLDVLEEAGLCKNVFKGEVRDGVLYLEFTEDRSGVKLTGIPGKAGQLDREIFESVDKASLEIEPNKKIFLFHTTIEELKPKEMSKAEGQPVSSLPKNFDYYAGGHIHIIDEVSLPGYQNVVYPGPLFPENFSELEKLEGGGFYIIENDNKKRVSIKLKEIMKVNLDCEDKRPEAVAEELKEELSGSLKEKIILVRVKGKLATGTLSDINFRDVFADCESRGAYHCMKNTAGVTTTTLEETESVAHTAEEAEQKIIKEHLGKVKAGMTEQEEEKLFHELINTLCRPQAEGEKKKEYEERILEEAIGLLDR